MCQLITTPVDYAQGLVRRKFRIKQSFASFSKPKNDDEERHLQQDFACGCSDESLQVLVELSSDEYTKCANRSGHNNQGDCDRFDSSVASSDTLFRILCTTDCIDNCLPRLFRFTFKFPGDSGSCPDFVFTRLFSTDILRVILFKTRHLFKDL